MGNRANLDARARRALWVSMVAIYGQCWLDSYGDSEGTGAKAWGNGLAGLSSDQVAAGVQACVTAADPYPPTLPEFRARCLGILSFPEVRHELRGDAARSLFTHMVWECLDRDAYARARGRAAQRLLREAYDLARVLTMRGAPPAPPPAPRLAIAHNPAPRPWRPPEPAERAALVERARADAGLAPGPGGG